MRVVILSFVLLLVSCNNPYKKNHKLYTNLEDISKMKDGDTLKVQLFTFDDIEKRKGTFQLPKKSNIWEKILLIRILKCDERTLQDKYPCGEWDTSSHTHLYVTKENGEEEIFELENYVTPYGKGLDLGEGFSYVYDISDYEPILRGDIKISSGNLYELQDVKILFIKGTPERDILSIENIYKWGSYTYENLSDEKDLKKKLIKLDSNAYGYKLRARISGHGHFGPRNCCEWDKKSHSYIINNWIVYKWIIWKNCGDNPIYPQGGTWQFDRAGWCPGTPVDTYDFELTPKVSRGDSIDIDYKIEPYRDNGEKGGYYILSHQLFSYGKPNFKNDVAVTDIIIPSDRDKYSRINPLFDNPTISVRNRGENDIRSLKIIYGYKGGENNEYLWKGNIKFLEDKIIELPVLNYKDIVNKNEFYVYLEFPNNKKDEYLTNNYRETKILNPVELKKDYKIVITPDIFDRAKELSYSLIDYKGNIYDINTELKEKEEHAIDLSKLQKGYYEFKIVDYVEDGMVRHWWKRNSDPDNIGINGSIKIVDKDNNLIKKLKYDFAEFERLRFYIK